MQPEYKRGWKASMNMNQFGESLATYRRNKGMTQEEFAMRMGVTPQAVSKWERGQSLPDLSLLEGICTILEVDANRLLHISYYSHISEKEQEDNFMSPYYGEPVMVQFGESIVPAFVEGLKTEHIGNKRHGLALEKGILVPVIRLRDCVTYKGSEYAIFLYGKVYHREVVEEIDEFTFYKIMDKVFAVCEKHYDVILNKQAVKQLVDGVLEKYPAVVYGLIPEKISYLFFKKVLIEMIREGVDISNLIQIIEVLEEETMLHNNWDIKEIGKRIIQVIGG